MKTRPSARRYFRSREKESDVFTPASTWSLASGGRRDTGTGQQKRERGQPAPRRSHVVARRVTTQWQPHPPRPQPHPPPAPLAEATNPCPLLKPNRESSRVTFGLAQSGHATVCWPCTSRSKDRPQAAQRYS